MDSLTFAQLVEPDERIMRSTLVPPGTTDEQRAEIAAERLWRMVADAGITPRAPDTLAKNFERLRSIHVYGLLCYDLFTQVDDQALLITEQALRSRFVDFYEQRIVLEKDDETCELPAQLFGEVYEAVRSRKYRGWHLRLRDGCTMPFNGSMEDLYRWARKEGLLGGQRNRHYEDVTVRQCHRVAHPDSYHLTWEVDSATAIRDLAELINRLWGEPGLGGRYSQTAYREVLALGWSDRDSLSTGRAIGLSGWREEEDYEVILVRAQWDDPTLSELDTAFDLSMFPVDHLFGPATRQGAIAWLEEHQPTDDHKAFHDRLFLIRRYGGRVDPPRQPEVAVALDANGRKGEWIAVRADHPTDAWVHARNQFDGVATYNRFGDCQVCATETVARGPFRVVLAKAEELAGPIVADTRSAVRVPGPRWAWRGVADGAEEEE